MNSYFFFDGSNLIAQVKQLQKARPGFRGHKLNVVSLLREFTSPFDGPLTDLLGKHGYRRATYYFAKGDDQVERYLLLPDFIKAHSSRDIEIRFCRARLPRSAKFNEWLENVPDEFRDRFQKSEKGVDIEICCDALQLAATGHLDRLLLFTNDSDFIPLCRKLKELGANISLLRLSDSRPANRELAEACDTYDVVAKRGLFTAFGLPTDAEEEKP